MGHSRGRQFYVCFNGELFLKNTTVSENLKNPVVMCNKVSNMNNAMVPSGWVGP
jgi:hypothetical protein